MLYEPSDPACCIKSLWESLSRAGPHVADETLLESIGSDRYYVAIRLRGRIPVKLHGSVRLVIRKQLAEQGWSVQRLRIKPWFIDFLLAKLPVKSV